MSLIPYTNYFVVEKQDQEQCINGFSLNTSNENDKFEMGKIVCLPANVILDGNERPSNLNIGDKVIYLKGSYYQTIQDNKSLVVIPVDSIIAINN